MMYDDSAITLSRTDGSPARLLRLLVLLAIMVGPALIGGLLATGWVVDPADHVRPVRFSSDR